MYYMPELIKSQPFLSKKANYFPLFSRIFDSPINMIEIPIKESRIVWERDGGVVPASIAKSSAPTAPASIRKPTKN